MSFLNSFLIPILARKVGNDQFGNKYYESNRSDYLGIKKRYVIYNGKILEPSKVPPLWHAWLHHLSAEPPRNETFKFPWQRKYLPNLTGSKLSSSQTKQKTIKYNSWKPKVG